MTEDRETKVQALIEAAGEIYDAFKFNAAPVDPIYALRKTHENVTIDPELFAVLLEAYLPLK